jgi:hypothetical protein
MTLTLQSVEKQDVEGILPEVVPVAQKTSQLVTGTPALQVPVVTVAVGVPSSIASSASSNNSSAIFERSIRGPFKEPGFSVPSSIPETTFCNFWRMEATLLISLQNRKQRPGSDIPRLRPNPFASKQHVSCNIPQNIKGTDLIGLT